MPLENEKIVSTLYSNTEINTAMAIAMSILQTPKQPELKHVDAARVVRQDILEISSKGHNRHSINKFYKVAKRILAVAYHGEKPLNEVKQIITEELVCELAAEQTIEKLLQEVREATRKDSESITSSLNQNIDTYQCIAKSYTFEKTHFEKLNSDAGDFYTQLNKAQCHHITDQMLIDMRQRVGNTFYLALHPLNEQLFDAVVHHRGDKSHIVQQSIKVLDTCKLVTEETFSHIQSQITYLLDDPLRMETLLKQIAETIYNESLREIEAEANKKKTQNTQKQSAPLSEGSQTIRDMIALQQARKKRSFLPVQ